MKNDVERGAAGARQRQLWFVAACAAGVLYAATSDRGPQWQDSGWHQIRILTGDITHSLGIALTHPVHYFLCRAAYLTLPLEPGYAITLVSALAGAVAVGNIALLVLRLTNCRLAVVFSAASLALGHTYWQHATHTESYTLVAALLTTEWLLIQRCIRNPSGRLLTALFLINGLGTANHMLAALATPVNVAFLVGVLRRREIRPSVSLLCSAAWVLGVCPLLYVMYLDWSAGAGIAQTLHSTLFGRYADDVLNVTVSPAAVALGVGYMAYNFPGLAIPLALVGLFRFRGFSAPTLRRVLIAETAIYLVFVARYTIVDQYSYFFILYLFVALYAGVGLAHMFSVLAPKRRTPLVIAALLTAFWTPVVYLGTARLLESRRMLRGLVGNKPYRNGYRSFFLPWGFSDDAADRLNREVASLIPDGGLIVVEDHMMEFGLEYAALLGRLNSDVEIILATETDRESAQWSRVIDEALRANRRVVIVPRDRDAPRVATDRAMERIGDVYLLKNHR